MESVLEWSISVKDLIWVMVGYVIARMLIRYGRNMGIRQGREEYRQRLQQTKLPSIINLPHLDGLPVACQHGEHPDDCPTCRH